MAGMAGMALVGRSLLFLNLRRNFSENSPPLYFLQQNTHEHPLLRTLRNSLSDRRSLLHR